ncbi:hypothetical protein [Jannaschia marina]|uniref:hypothetical protein n=1 Tax=Jannaschia marina TaxID=2741674 RepID=UPI0015C8F6DB|nr:hypothetical protein [Jannaschia marina]
MSPRPVLLGLALIAGAPAAAEIVPVREAGPDVRATLEAMEDTVVRTFVWDVDVDGDGTAERVVQAGFTPGGNGWYTRFFVFAAYRAETPVEVNAGPVAFFDQVETGQDGPFAVTRSYGPGDGRCCPSVIGRMSLRLDDLDTE